MALYKLTLGPVVLRTDTGAGIPTSVGNRHYQEYLDWLAAGNVADPADPAPLPDTDLQIATRQLQNDPVFRALVKVLATHFGLTVPQMVNEIKAQV